ncbi:MAG: GNAT family N-acetyltransferase [Burkholderiales bacterium]|jgi:ribosomal protein S18 acetylase RimI-like enzyme|nr:GNAT family N-acetyltransferase [Burkholderiales bacterium]
MSSSDIVIEPLREADIPALIALARDTWFKHYPDIITTAQIEYMLAQRYSDAVIRAQLADPDIWWDRLLLDGELAAFAQYERSDPPGTLKVDKLYARHELRGRGLGSTLLRHIEDEARAMGFSRLKLQVNKNNVSAIGAYRKNGFVVAESAVFDIGHGFVMDDYVMVKELPALPVGNA